MTKFIHFRNIIPAEHSHEWPYGFNHYGGMTIAYDLTSDGTSIIYAVAKCHPNDRYIKHEGRNKAAGRLKALKHPPRKIPYDPSMKVVEQVLRDVMEREV